MANRRRGEVDLDLAGTRYTLCLTLGALAELEDTLGAGDLSGLAARFSDGRLAGRDLIALLGAARGRPCPRRRGGVAPAACRCPRRHRRGARRHAGGRLRGARPQKPLSATGGPEPGAIPAFPWDDALSFAFRRLGWRPADVWAATPRELAAALDRLLAAFPDHP